MNQRSSRHSRKNNKLDFMSISTGGQIARHSPNEVPQIQVPPKATGDIKPDQNLTPQLQPGIAKASPNFKPINPSAKKLTKETEQKVIADNSTPVVEPDETNKE